MTREQIEQMAKEYADEKIYVCGRITAEEHRVVTNAYVAGANSRQPEIDALRAQTARMSDDLSRRPAKYVPDDDCGD